MILLEISKIQEKITKSKNLSGLQFYHICLELYRYMDKKKKKIKTTIL